MHAWPTDKTPVGVTDCAQYYILLQYSYVIYCVYILGVARYMYSYRTVTVQASRLSPYDEYRQFTPNPEGGARSNATLFDNRQQKNSECQRWHRGGCADVWLIVFYLIKYQLAVKLAMLELMCFVRVCGHAPARSLQLFPYTSRINFKHLLSY